MDKHHFVPPEYEENFRKAEIVFRYQRVFDTKTRQCVHLRDPADENIELCQGDIDYAGPYPFHVRFMKARNVVMI